MRLTRSVTIIHDRPRPTTGVPKTWPSPSPLTGEDGHMSDDTRVTITAFIRARLDEWERLALAVREAWRQLTPSAL